MAIAMAMVMVMIMEIVVTKVSNDTNYIKDTIDS